jgi:glutamyl-tRNA synthetase
LGRALSEGERERLLKAMAGLKPRAKTIVELAEKAWFYVAPRPIRPSADAAKLLNAEARHLLGELAGSLNGGEWRAGALEQRLREFANSKNAKFGAVAQPLRAALTGSTASPGIFEVMEALGRDESLGRIVDAAGSSG